MVIITVMFFLLAMTGTIFRLGGAVLLTTYLASLALEFLTRIW